MPITIAIESAKTILQSLEKKTGGARGISLMIDFPVTGLDSELKRTLTAIQQKIRSGITADNQDDLRSEIADFAQRVLKASRQSDPRFTSLGTP